MRKSSCGSGRKSLVDSISELFMEGKKTKKMKGKKTKRAKKRKSKKLKRKSNSNRRPLSRLPARYSYYM
jgi:hypothetical protein